jgi:peptidoglycan hydrolase-like protein with peptidoglycan-binding domain
VGLAAVLTVSLVGVGFAQRPGGPKPPASYDAVGEMRYNAARGAPDAIVREAQRVLSEQGYYQGPLDGIRGPETRRAIWDFQKAKGLRVSGSLDSRTLEALDLTTPATGSASPPSSFESAPGRAPSLDEFQAP